MAPQVDEGEEVCFIIFNIMSPPDVFEKTASQKQQLNLMREKAQAERDLMWLRQQNQEHSFLVRSIVLFSVLFLACLLVTAFSARHFYGLLNPPPHCLHVLFDARNFFGSLCVSCEPLFKLQGGICIPT